MFAPPSPFSVVGRLLLVGLTFLVAAPSVLPAAEADPNWWKSAVIYEIYPRSFGDTNGDGIGDMNGITAHLDYLQALGVDAIWIAPFFPSPQVDFGYDISDFKAIDPQYGTMADFENLLVEAKKRNIHVLADFVLNHTSDKHPWFIESESSKTNPKADWYMWHDPKGNKQPPNNWISIFGHSAWEYVAARNQFYYHAFYKEQPDLNWNNPEVREAMYDVVRFWMRKGVSGFRLDAITHMFEDKDMRDEPYAPGTNKFGDRAHQIIYTDNLPEIHGVLQELRKVTDEFPGSVLVGEAYLNTVNDLARMYGEHNDELQLPMDLQLGFTNRLDIGKFRSILTDSETKINGNTPLFVFENHDNSRLINRYGDGKHNDSIARLLATLLLTPKDAALLYYGQEIGMVDHPPKRKEDVQDPIGKIGWPREKGRDGVRTPMQWNSDNQAGFSSTKSTWLPVGSDYKTINVASEERDPNSLLNFYKKLIQLRRSNPQLREGEFAGIDEANKAVLSYLRKTPDGKAVLVSLNLTASPQKVSLAEAGGKSATALVSSYPVPNGDVALGGFTLPPFGSLVAQVQ